MSGDVYIGEKLILCQRLLEGFWHLFYKPELSAETHILEYLFYASGVQYDAPFGYEVRIFSLSVLSVDWVNDWNKLLAHVFLYRHSTIRHDLLHLLPP